MTPIDTFTPAPGLVARVYYDDEIRNPWDEEDGHISTEYFDRRADVPSGWTVMSTHGRGYWAFDLGAALLKASREGWGLSPDSREYKWIRVKDGHKKPTRSQIRYAAVKADAARMADYINGGWHYVGVSVSREGEDENYEHAVWGIESDCEDYWHDVAKELICEM
jgi:hypothetical protein